MCRLNPGRSAAGVKVGDRVRIQNPGSSFFGVGAAIQKIELEASIPYRLYIDGEEDTKTEPVPFGAHEIRLEDDAPQAELTGFGLMLD
jgi:hypothetical protein